MNRRLLRTVLLLLALAPLPGCMLADIALPPRLRELTVVAVEPALLHLGLAQPIPALRVTVTAEQKLEWITERYALGIGTFAALCRDGNLDGENRLDSTPVRNAATNQRLEVNPPNVKSAPEGHQTYVFELPERTNGSRLTSGFGNRPGYRWRDHDLRQDPVDVCIQLRGGNVALTHFTSNVVRIPAETIRAALPRAPLR